MLKQQSEDYYCKLVFASSDYPVDSLHPKLEICLDRNTLGVNDAENATLSVKLFPNPTSENLNIQLSQQGDIWLELVNVLGKTVFQHDYKATSLIQISTVDFSSGVYFLRISNNQGFSAFKKVIIR